MAGANFQWHFHASKIHRAGNFSFQATYFARTVQKAHLFLIGINNVSTRVTHRGTMFCPVMFRMLGDTLVTQRRIHRMGTQISIA